ncbi:hypothetical protein ACET3Z_007897 [Daucus carota]
MLVMRCYFELDLGTSEIEVDKLSEMKQKIENLGISCDFTSPGQYIVLTCPKETCNVEMFSYGMWMGRSDNDVNQANKLDISRKTEESLRLEPLSHELTAYFADRMISEEVLQKNSVMQLSTDQVEGEIDKLSMEQAGLANSVSVPDGAPQKVSTEELPSPDKVK